MAFGLVLLVVTYIYVIPKGPDQILIGHADSLSGKYEKNGKQGFVGAQASIRWINEVYGGVKIGKKRVPLVYQHYDVKSQKKLITKYLEQLITQDKVDFIITPYSSSLTLHAAPILEKHGILYMDYAAASNRLFRQGFEYIVQVGCPATGYHMGTLDMLHKIDPDAKLAILSEDAPFAAYTMFAAEKRAKQLNFNIVYRGVYPKGAKDLRPQLTDLKEKNPDIVIGGGHFKDGVVFAKQMSALGINPKAMSLVSSVPVPAYYKELGVLAEGVAGPSKWEIGVGYSPSVAREAGMKWFGPTQEEFINLFSEVSIKHFGKKLSPSYHGAQGATAVLILVKGIEAANSLDSDIVRKAISKIKLMTFFGLFEIDETGIQVAQSMVTVQWQNGRKVIVWPPEAATGKLHYPKPVFGKKTTAQKYQ